MSDAVAMVGDPALEPVQRMVAIVSVSASAVRKAGASGVVAAARDYLATVNLKPFAVRSAAEFISPLERTTECLVQTLPEAGRSWGVARKCLNIFLRDCLYNWYLRTHFDLGASEAWFEAPLDAIVAQGLRRLPGGGELPPWPGVKHLTHDISDAYQRFAVGAAERYGVRRVHLDLYLWAEARP